MTDAVTTAPEIDGNHPVVARTAEWARAIVHNDPGSIATFVTPTWVLVDPVSGPITLSRFLDVVRDGRLTHDSFVQHVARLDVFQDAVVTLNRVATRGTWLGDPIGADEWTTDVWVRVDAEWRCARTHLSRADAS